MKRVFTFGGQAARRNLTVADLIAGKGQRKFTQTTANTADEARAATDAGIDLLISGAPVYASAREGAPEHFISSAVQMMKFPSRDEALREAYRLLEAGADTIYCPREPAFVESLASASVPVMGHVGLVPRKSTWIGGVRAFGRTAEEALALFGQIKDLENAGVYCVEVEVTAADALTEISRRTSVVTISLGSGGGGDVDYLFQEDICGINDSNPRHAKAYGDLRTLQARLYRERVAALRAFHDDVAGGGFPPAENTVMMHPSEHDKLIDGLENA